MVLLPIFEVQTQRVRNFYSSFIDERKLVTIPINPDFNRVITVKEQNIIFNVGRL